jgi:hypothetical protein
VVVTLTALLAESPLSFGDPHTNRDGADVIREAVLRSKEDLENGALVTVQPGRVRIRRLPLSA